MKLRNGLEVHYRHRVTMYGGSKAYAFWEADCFCPLVYFVRGDNFSDAYANFIEELPRVEVDDPALEPEDLRLLESGEGIPGGYDFTETGELVYTELVQGCNILGSFD